tara:strand:+ start:243 stop:506 length:264 start_codon:yes stop_codon:yes gene_type:complete
MTEQQNHLASLLQQRQTLLDEITELNNQAAQKRELVLRALGAIEYLQQIGVTLPAEGEEAPQAPEEEAPAEESVEPEVVEEPVVDNP